MAQAKRQSDRLEFWLPWIIAAIFFVLFFLLMPRTIGFGDCGELAAAAVTLGISHPPGHPGYLFPAWFWTTLFGGQNPGFVLNILSALIASANVVVLCRLLKTAAACFDIGQPSVWIRVSAAIAWTTLPFVWHYGTHVEVYQLQWFWLLLFFDAFLKLGKTGEIRAWNRTWLFLGLAIMVHPYSVFFAAFPLAFLALNRSSFKARWLIWPGLSALLTLLSYLSLVLVGLRKTAFQWPRGEGVQGWVDFFLAREFSHRAATGQFLELLDLQWNITLPEILAKGILPVLILGGLAWLALWLSGRRFGRHLNLVFALGTIGFWLLPFFSRSLRYGLDQMSYFFCPLLLLLGAGVLATETTFRRLGRWRHLGAGVFLTVTAISIWAYRSVPDRSDNVFPLFLAQCITFNVPAESLIVVKDDESYFSLMYYQYALNKRRDIKVVHVDLLKHHPEFFKNRYPDLNILLPLPQNSRDVVQSLVDANTHERNVFWFGEDALIAGAQDVVRYDHLVWFNPKPSMRPFSFLSFFRGLPETQRGAYSQDLVAQSVFGGIIQRMVVSLMTQGQIDRAEKLVRDWLDLNHDDPRGLDLMARVHLIRGDSDKAEALTDRLLAIDGTSDVALHTKSMVLKSRAQWEERRALLEPHRRLLRSNTVLAQDYLESLIELGLFDEARKFLTDHPLKEALALSEVDLLYHSGEPRAAIKRLEEVVSARPWDQAALEYLIFLCTIEGDDACASKWTAELQGNLPADPNALSDDMILRQILK